MVELKKLPYKLNHTNQSTSTKNSTISPTTSVELLETTSTQKPTESPIVNNDLNIDPAQPSSGSLVSSVVSKKHDDDDEDTENDIDYEASGGGVGGSINWNDTTIQLDDDNRQ